MLHHIAYTSAAPEPVTPEHLTQILKVSERNNARDAITGILLYHDQDFFQVLEGEKDAVEACFARIVGDTRHTGVLRLWNQPVDDRVFAHWVMGYAGPDHIQVFTSPSQDSLTRFLRLRDDAPGKVPVALALARQMYKRFRFSMMPYSGPILT